MITTYDVINKLPSLRIETKVTILEILQCTNTIESQYREKGVKGQSGLGKIKVYDIIRWFWALHVFEYAFGGIWIFEDVFDKSSTL